MILEGIILIARGIILIEGEMIEGMIKGGMTEKQ